MQRPSSRSETRPMTLPTLTGNDDMEGIRRFQKFFMDNYTEQINEILFKKETALYYSLRFNFMELLDSDHKLADFLMTNPDTAITWANTALFQAQEQHYNTLNPHYKKRRIRDKFDDGPRISIKHKCKARIIGQLLYPCRNRPTVSDIRSKDVSQIIQIRGTVIRQSKAKLLESSRKYICLVCKFTFEVQADIINEKDIEFPRNCLNQERSCKSSKFQPIQDSTEAIDFQEIYLQEQIQKLGLGKIPRSIRVVLSCDLSDSCMPGDDVEIIGIVRYHWGSMGQSKAKGDSRFDIQMYIEAVSVCRTDVIGGGGIDDNDVQYAHLNYRTTFDTFWTEIGKEKPMKARNMILANLCPQLCGMYIIKLAAALTIIGGTPREEFGTHIRGQSHLLLVGDPGTGKSQLLRYAARMTSRSVLTTGIGTTSAGLTVSAVKDGGEWVLEAGALVLADGGICCIDEFGSVREHDRGVIHEAMEQQTISVAKGGFVCSLNSRSTVLAAMNPPSGGFDGTSDLSLNTNMATSLLSRFDIILLLLDQKNDEWDRKVGQHLMDNLCEPEFTNIDWFMDCENTQCSVDGNGNSNSNTPGFDHNHNGVGGHQPEWNSTAQFERDMARFDEMREERVHWTIDQMQAYFKLVKQLKVEFTPEAESILTEYYALQRIQEKRDKSRTTIRLLESLIRLAQAHCRLMYRELVLPVDSIQAVYLMEKSLVTTNNIRDYSVLQTVFPRNPGKEYSNEREEILSKLFPKEWRQDKCEQKCKDVAFDYGQYIKQREIKECEKMANESNMFEESQFDNDIDYNQFENVKNKNKKEVNNEETFTVSCNSSLYANNDEFAIVKNKNKGNNEFSKPIQSLTQKLQNLSQNNENKKSDSRSPSPLKPIQAHNSEMNKDTPPGFGRRKSMGNSNQNRNDKPPGFGELSHCMTPTNSVQSKDRMRFGSMNTNSQSEGMHRSDRKRKREEMNGLLSNANERVKKRRLNELPVHTKKNKNTQNRERNSLPGTQTEIVLPQKENVNIGNDILSVKSNASPWDETEFSFGFENDETNKQTTDNNNAQNKKKKRKKKFF